MKRTTISLPEDVLRRLRRLALEEDKSMAALIREAVEERLSKRRPAPRSLGVAASGRPDTARRTVDSRPEPRAWR